VRHVGRRWPNGRAAGPVVAGSTALVALVALSACAGNAPHTEPTTATAHTTVPLDATTTDAPKPPADVPYYTVVQGDTVGRIATKLGVDAQTVIDANGIANPNKISIGQKLRVPAGGRAPDGSIVGGAPASAGAATATATTATTAAG
jgi:LysM repeat protein